MMILKRSRKGLRDGMEAWQMLNRDQNVQECDATDDDSRIQLDQNRFVEERKGVISSVSREREYF